MPDHMTPISGLHEAYCRGSGLPVSLSMERIWLWEAWMSHGWTEADLLMVLAYLKRKSDSGQHWARNALQFSSLIRDCSRYEELLMECRAQARVKQVNLGKAQVLRATGRDATAPTSEPRSAAQVLRGDEALKALLQLRDSL